MKTFMYKSNNLFKNFQWKLCILSFSVMAFPPIKKRGKKQNQGLSPMEARLFWYERVVRSKPALYISM